MGPERLTFRLSRSPPFFLPSLPNNYFDSCDSDDFPKTLLWGLGRGEGAPVLSE